MQTLANRDGKGFRGVAHGDVSRRPPTPLDAVVPGVPGATRTTSGFGICPSFKDHLLSRRTKPKCAQSQLFHRCTDMMSRRLS
jgi:hypothetical protein